jgi:hypothetical protein
MARNHVRLSDTDVGRVSLARRYSCLKIVTQAILSGLLFGAVTLQAQQISLQALVTPSTTITKEGHRVTFALYGFVEFASLAQVFPYIDAQTRRWKGRAALG